MTHDYAFIYAKVARHVAAADVAMRQGMHGRARDELNQAMNAIETFEITTATVQPTYWGGYQIRPMADQSNNHLPIHDD